MGTVYLAKDVKLGRAVAIKVLHPMLTNELGIARFQSEIRIAAGLHHANIISVHDSGEADGRLYYVMDYLGGETLRDRLNREKQLSVEDALGIVEHVASGLQYAHGHGVVHRDIKPENILLAEGRACVVDFGLARALGDVDAQRLTASGLSVGTPHYLAPEQAAAERDVGPKADQYALACVLYEMLVGEPPFTGPTATSIAMRHITEEPRPMDRRRRSTPPAVTAAVMRAMEKVPADRFASVQEFAAALKYPVQRLEDSTRLAPNGKHVEPIGAERSRRRVALAVAAVLGITLSVLGWSYVNKTRSLDPTKFLLTSEQAADSVSAKVVRSIERGFSEWREVTAIGGSQQIEGSALQPLTLTKALKVGKRLGARNVVQIQIDGRGDSVDVSVSLYDVAGDSMVRRSRGSLAVSDGGPDGIMGVRRLISGVLRTGDELPWRDAVDHTSASLPAWRAYDAGRAALLSWNLPGAERAFRDAIIADPSLPVAPLWLAQTIAWSDTGRFEEGRAAAARSLSRRGGLSTGDSARALGLLALFSADYPAACQTFRWLLTRDSTDVGAWLNLGDCQARDRTVIADKHTSTGWAFRTSFESAARAYRRAAVSADISMGSLFRGWILGRLSKVLFATTNHVRMGAVVAADSTYMGAFPYLDGDSIAFAPHPISDFRTRKGDPPPALIQAAAVRSRNNLRAYAEDWVRSAPNDPIALDSLATWSELSGGFASVNGRQTPTLELLRAAQAIAKDSTQRLRLGISEVRILVKEGAFTDARAKVDSLLRAGGAERYRDVPGIAGMMALVGRVHETSRLLPLARVEHHIQLPNGRTWDPPRPVEEAAASLLTYAVFGAYPDSVRAASRRTCELIARYVPDTARASAIRSVMVAGAFGYGDAREAIVPGFEFQPPDEVVSAVLMLAHGDTINARRQLQRLKDIDRGKLPGNGFRLAFRTAIAWLAVGDTAEAVRHLDDMLLTLPLLDPAFLNEVSHVASVVRAFALRAELAEHLGDSGTAAANARVVVAVWGNADAEIQPLVTSMRAIARARR